MNEFCFNHFRTRRFKDNILVVTEQGDWRVLTKKEFGNLTKGKFSGDVGDSGILLRNNNFGGVVEKQRSRYAHLFRGPSLHIMVPTLRCNLKCHYCHSKAKPENSNGYDMDKKTARRIIDFIFQTPNKNIKIEFQGGEPLLNFEVVKESIEYAGELNQKAKKSLKFALVTNLTKIDDQKIKYLINHGVGLCTSLDGPMEVHDKVRFFCGGGGSYNRVVGWIKTIKGEYNCPLDALMVTTRRSLRYSKDIVDQYVALGFQKMQIKFLSKLGYAQEAWKDLSYSAEEYLDFWRKTIDYLVELNVGGVKIRESITTYILKKILTDEANIFVDLQSPCGAAISQLAYDHNGDIYTCDEGRQYEMFKLGNVATSSYKDILTSDGAASIISASTNDCFLCDACVYKPYCGLCPVCCYAETGTVVPKLAMSDRCKILKGMFDYIFEKLIFSSRHKEIFIKWANTQS